MKKHIFSVFIIAILGIISYTNSLGNDFVWDDRALVVKNDYIKDAKFIPKVFTTDLHHKEGRGRGIFYRPIQSLSFMYDYAIWGLKPFGFHFSNLLLHILNAILVYFLIILLFKDKTIALISSLLFIAHPVHTQAVSYISGRADLLGASFLLLSSIAFIKYIHSSKGRIYYYLCSVIFFILGLLSKEAVIILPLVLFLYGWFIRSQEKPPKAVGIKDLSAFLVIIGFYAFLRLTILGYSSGGAMPHSLYIRLLTFLKAIVTYLRLLIFPFGLHMERILRPSVSLFEPQTFLSAVLLIAICAIVVMLRKRFKLISFGAFWFLILLLPASNIIPLNAAIAEHWLYLPSIGFFLILATILAEKIMPKFKKTTLVFLIIILGLFSLMTLRQNIFWKDNLSLFQRALVYSPENYRLHNNLGIVYSEKGRFKDAISHYNEAIRIKPNYRDAHYNLGVAYFRLGRYAKARRLWQEALRIDPNYTACRRRLEKLKEMGY